ncbi:MAG: hypothetical protein ABSA97_07345 [Verrucomicrobiia bacterium]
MDIPEITAPTYRSNDEPQEFFSFTRYTMVAAIVCATNEIKPWAGGDSLVHREAAGERYFEFRFEQSDLAETIKHRCDHHRDMIREHPDHWISRCLDYFHNRERLMEIIHGPPCAIRRPFPSGRRLYIEQITGPEIKRTVLASDGKLTFDNIDLIAFLLGQEDLRLDRQNPMTTGPNMRRFNFTASAKLNRAIQIFHESERFRIAAPEDWRSYVLATIENYHDLLFKILPKPELQRLQRRLIATDTGNVRAVKFCHPITQEEANATNQ